MAAVGRVTQGLQVQRTLSNLNRQLQRISVFQERLATGLKVNRPSDSPIDARRAISLRTQIDKHERFLSNISDVGPQLEETATTLLNVVDIIHRATELTVQGASETFGQSQLDSIALEIDGLLEGLVAAGNHRTGGRSIFAGTQTLADAFSVTRVGGEITSVTYEGNEQSIEVDISEGIRSTTNISGTVAFQSTVDLFSTLIGIRDDLRAGNQANLRNVRLGELQTGLDQTLFGVARVGSIQNRLERVSNDTQDFIIEFRESLSDRLDADFADTVLNLNVAQNAFEAGLNAAGRVLQPSLLDFLR